MNVQRAKRASVTDPRIAAVHQIVRNDIEAANRALENELDRSGWFLAIENLHEVDFTGGEEPPSSEPLFDSIENWEDRVTSAVVAGYERAVSAGQVGDDAKREIMATLKQFPAGHVLNRMVDARIGVVLAGFPDERFLQNIDSQIAGAVERAHLERQAKPVVTPAASDAEVSAEDPCDKRLMDIFKNPRPSIKQAMEAIGIAIGNTSEDGIIKPVARSRIYQLIEDGELDYDRTELQSFAPGHQLRGTKINAAMLKQYCLRRIAERSKE